MDKVNNELRTRMYINQSLDYRLNLEDNLDVLNEIVNIKNKIKSDESKEGKLSFNSESKLIELLYDIVNANNIDPYVKQLSIENTILEYDLDWFNKQIGNSVDIRSIILHDIYKKLIHCINKIIKKYVINDFELLLKDLKSDNINTKGKAMTVLVFIFLGEDKTISLVFSELINILSRFNSSSVTIGENRTEVLFKISQKIFRVCLILKEKLSSENKYVQKLNKYLSIQDIKNIFKIIIIF